ncbi:hypothetical protein IU474_00920 [Nocardia otitidiscaviarum]|nr:hypothetical protein [Nocardia otitidiscaviarum]
MNSAPRRAMAAGTTVPAGTIAAVGDQQNIGFPQGGPLRVWINENGTASRSLLPVPTAPSMGAAGEWASPVVIGSNSSGAAMAPPVVAVSAAATAAVAMPIRTIFFIDDTSCSSAVCSP